MNHVQETGFDENKFEPEFTELRTETWRGLHKRIAELEAEVTLKDVINSDLVETNNTLADALAEQELVNTELVDKLLKMGGHSGK